MPAIDFPAAPAVNDEYSFEGRTWLWNGTGWEVKSYPAALQLGSASAPSLYFTGDPNTGLYSPGADQVAITTGGTGRLFVASDGKVGIGTSSPGSSLTVVSSSTNLVNFQGAEYSQIRHTDGTRVFYTQVYNNAAAVGTETSTPLLLSTNNTERARIDSSGKLLVGTSSATTAARPFLGTSTPVTPISQIEGYQIYTDEASRCFMLRGNSALDIYPYFALVRSKGTTLGSNTTVANGDNIGALSFQGTDGTNSVEAASIVASVDGTPGSNDMPGRLVFSTTADGASSPTEAMRITSAGRVGIGATSAPGGGDARVWIDQSTVNDQGLLINASGGTKIPTLWFRDANATQPGRIVGQAGLTLATTSSATTAVTIDSSQRVLIGTASATANGGVLQVSNGITFPATQSACTDVNTLDDYEEGTWTPTVEGMTLAGTGTYTTQVGRYTKIGNTVVAHLWVDWSNHTGTGNIRIASLPFTSANVANLGPTFSLYADRFSYTGSIIGVQDANTTKAALYIVNNGSASSLGMDTSAQVVATITYQAA